MDLDSKVLQYLNQLDEKNIALNDLKELVSVIDLTSLNEEDTNETIQTLCLKATTSLGHVASVCIYPKFIKLVADLLKDTDIAVCSVANFPTGKDSLSDTLVILKKAIADGATEMDIVFPLSLYRTQPDEALAYVEECKKTCRKNVLKVILEISEFDELDEIYQLCTALTSTSIDYIKTSTGRSKHGATLEAAGAILTAIKASKSTIGFKASGGIREVNQALAYIWLAKKIMGSKWVAPTHFRIGASSLIDKIVNLGS